MLLPKHSGFRTTATFPCLSFSTAFADQVVPKSGDRVTGTIVKKHTKNLTIKSTNFGVITTAWGQLAGITAETQVNVVLQDGRTLRGTLATPDGKVQVNAENATVTVTPTEISALRDADTSRVTNADKTSLFFNAIKASDLLNGKKAETARAARGGVAYDHNVSPRVFMSVFNDCECDRFQDLDLQFVIRGGAGLHSLTTDTSRLDLLAGFDFNDSSFSTPLTRNSGELFWGNEYNLKLNSSTFLIQSFRMFNNLSDTGTYRGEPRHRHVSQPVEIVDMERLG